MPGAGRDSLVGYFHNKGKLGLASWVFVQRTTSEAEPKLQPLGTPQPSQTAGPTSAQPGTGNPVGPKNRPAAARTADAGGRSAEEDKIR